MTLDLSAIPAIDAHCHPYAAASAQTTAEQLRDAISVSLRGVTSPLNETMLLSRIAIRNLAALLDCDASYAAVIAARNDAAANYPAYIQRLFTAQNIAGLLVDPGFPLAPTIPAADFATLMPVPVWEGYRIERFFIERAPARGSFHGAAGDPPRERFTEVLDAFTAELDWRATQPGFTFFKSVMAYLTGLAIAPVSDVEVAAAWQEHRAFGDAAEKVIRDYLFRVICAKARQYDVPFQLHTGHTSDRNVWPNVNPILLAPVLNESATTETTIVLVHSGYPFCTEAGYLTSVFPNIYCDLSLMIPWSSVGIARRIAEVLEAAPTAKVMFGTDAIHLPEMNWLGALVGRRGLARALEYLVAVDALTAGEAEEVAVAILHANAERVYPLRERRPVPRHEA